MLREGGQGVRSTQLPLLILSTNEGAASGYIRILKLKFIRGLCSFIPVINRRAKVVFARTFVFVRTDDLEFAPT
jgi:hypothetical protein